MNDSVTDRLSHTHKRIIDAKSKFGREKDIITLLAVSKSQPIALLEETYTAGQRDFGENYCQEALRKIAQIPHPDLCWHYIGKIQKNKTRALSEHFHWVQTVESQEIALRLNNQRPITLAPLNVCIEVNVSNEDSKSGIKPEEVLALAEFITQQPHLHFRGLMTIPQLTQTFEEQRKPFKLLNEIFKDLQQKGFPIDTLSMGMSLDLEAAIAEGSTLLRIGTAIFGERIS